MEDGLLQGWMLPDATGTDMSAVRLWLDHRPYRYGSLGLPAKDLEPIRPHLTAALAGSWALPQLRHRI